MRKTKIIKINDREITVKELTVSQIIKIMDSSDDPDINDIDMLFPDRLPSSALVMSLGMKIEALTKYAPSEIESMLDAVEEINPTFAGLIQRLANVGRAALAAKKSEEPSAA